MSGLNGHRVLITGGTGFIGCRLAERLVLEHGATVRVLLSRFVNAPRVARLPVEFAVGDITNAKDVADAAAECQYIVHCAYGSRGTPEDRRRVNVEGTRNVLDAALAHKPRRVVHLSSLAAYGNTPDGDLTEDSPMNECGNEYADAKLAAERLVWNYFRKHQLPVTIQQPTAVYGPFAPVWAAGVIQQMRTGRIVLVNGGTGLCNCVYIDDAVQAIILGLTNEQAIGEAFLVSSEQPVTWREFYGRFEQMLGYSATIDLPAAQATGAAANGELRATSVVTEMWRHLRDRSFRERLEESREVTALKQLAKRVLSQSQRKAIRRRLSRSASPTRHIQSTAAKSSQNQRPIHVLRECDLPIFTAKTRVCINKAVRLLGYRPSFSFEQGMELTEQWARWANLLGPAVDSQEQVHAMR